MLERVIADEGHLVVASRSGSGPRLVRQDRCPVCGHGGAAFAFASPDLLYDVPGLFAYERCSACRSLFQEPRVAEEDLPLCYPAGYFTHGGVAGQELTASTGRLQRLLRTMALGSPSTQRAGALGW